MRINKYLALKKISTRRGADELVADKKVFINGSPAILGSRVHEGDVVEIKKFKREKYLYYAYNKPVGVETDSPQKGLFPLGRLDKASHGLMILTNDGRITDRLLHPDHDHEKEYVVELKQPLQGNFLKKMAEGVLIEGYRTKKCLVTSVSPRTFRIVLTEGKKHQIRRMCAALGNDVALLKRIRIMNIRLGTLKAGAFRLIEGNELADFLRKIGLK